MSWGATLVAIVAIVAWAIVRHARIQVGDIGTKRRGHGDPTAIGPSPREIELQREVEELRERIQVLERIAIDGRQARDIAAQIENLRDQ